MLFLRMCDRRGAEFGYGRQTDSETYLLDSRVYVIEHIFTAPTLTLHVR